MGAFSHFTITPLFFPRREWATCKEQAWEDRRGVHGGGFDFNAETQWRGGVCGIQPMGTVPVGIRCKALVGPRLANREGKRVQARQMTGGPRSVAAAKKQK